MLSSWSYFFADNKLFNSQYMVREVISQFPLSPITFVQATQLSLNIVRKSKEGGELNEISL